MVMFQEGTLNGINIRGKKGQLSVAKYKSRGLSRAEQADQRSEYGRSDRSGAKAKQRASGWESREDDARGGARSHPFYLSWAEPPPVLSS